MLLRRLDSGNYGPTFTHPASFFGPRIDQDLLRPRGQWRSVAAHLQKNLRQYHNLILVGTRKRLALRQCVLREVNVCGIMMRAGKDRKMVSDPLYKCLALAALK